MASRDSEVDMGLQQSHQPNPVFAPVRLDPSLAQFDPFFGAHSSSPTFRAMIFEPGVSGEACDAPSTIFLNDSEHPLFDFHSLDHSQVNVDLPSYVTDSVSPVKATPTRFVQCQQPQVARQRAPPCERCVRCFRNKKKARYPGACIWQVLTVLFFVQCQPYSSQHLICVECVRSRMPASLCIRKDLGDERIFAKYMSISSIHLPTQFQLTSKTQGKIQTISHRLSGQAS